VSALTGLESEGIIYELRRHIASYPEEDVRQKYVHFMIYERAFKWLFEGEDRNRFYFWSTTPFTGIRFFDAAMRCPDEQKSYHRLYREFLLGLCPAATAIESVGIGAPITSDKFRMARKALALLGERPDQRRRVKMILGSAEGYDSDSMVMQCIRQQIENDGSIFEYLSESSVRKIIDGYAERTTEEIDRLFTIISTIEDLITGRSILEQYL
jgi:asparagine synthase (glutamine-hydrolysing)